MSTPVGTELGMMARWAVMLAAVLGSAVFDLTWIIVGVALPYMQGTFSATPDQIAWVMTAYIVGGTMMTAVGGWASTRYGRKQLFIGCIVLNVLTTIACGMADSLATEVAWRFVQGMFSAPLLALGQGIVIDAFPDERRGFATGVWTAFTVGAAVMAPTLGGYLVETFNWRWVFFAITPVGFVAAVVAWLVVPATKPDPDRRLDWAGFAAVVVLVGAFQLAMSRGGRLEWFESVEICIELAVAALALLVVVIQTVWSPHPFLERRLFLDSNYVVSIVFMVMFGALVTLPVVLMPLMLQQVAGYPPIAAGALMIPRGLGVVIMSMLVGVLSRNTDPRLLLGVGFTCGAGANLYMATWTAEVDGTAILLSNLLQGFATGAVFVPMVTTALATLPRALHTEAAAFMFLILNVGKAFGVAVVFALHTRLEQVNYVELAALISPINERIQLARVPKAWDLDTVSGLASLSAEITRQAQFIAYLDAFLGIGVITLVGVPFVFLAKRGRNA